jgi:hypothetical protein
MNREAKSTGSELWFVDGTFGLVEPKDPDEWLAMRGVSIEMLRAAERQLLPIQRYTNTTMAGCGIRNLLVPPAIVERVLSEVT